MKSFAATLAEARRSAILRLLAESPEYEAGAAILYEALPGCGVPASLDQVHGDLAWLAEQQLITTEAVLDILLARITTRGLDAALGRATIPGVARPAP